MGLFGRPSRRDDQRAERARLWVAARSPYAIASAMFGLMAALDSFTGVLGLLLGLAAVVTGVLGLRDIDQRPQRLGKRLCALGIALGTVGIGVGVLVWTILW